MLKYLFFMLLIWRETFKREICCDSNISKRTFDWPIPSFHLRRYEIEETMREWKKLLRAKKLKQHEMETQRKYKEMIKMENERRRVFVKYLLAFQGASSFLKDFHSIRY